MAVSEPTSHDKAAYLLRWASVRLVGRLTQCEKTRLPLVEQQVWKFLEDADRRSRLQELDAGIVREKPPHPAQVVHRYMMDRAERIRRIVEAIKKNESKHARATAAASDTAA